MINLPKDEKWMRMALDLARRGVGRTSPNPPVGAVIVKAGRMVGRGWHRKAGGPHAEVEAIADAGRKARGGTLYVTLEPCSTEGRTGPCTDAVIDAGIKTVFAAVRDPNPAHRGRGLRILSRAGVKASYGVCEQEAALLIRPFATWVTEGRPHTILKLGISMDGKIADRTGRSRWITSSKSRAAVQELRKKADVVMVGSGTLLADDPSLLPSVRPGQTRRLVVDTACRAPLTSKIFTDGRSNVTIVAAGRSCTAGRIAQRERTGAEVWTVAEKRGHVSLKALMKKLAKSGATSVLCEGGGGIASSLIREGLVDEVVLFVAPKVIGGSSSRDSVGGKGWLLSSCPDFEFESVEQIGRDIMIRALPSAAERKHS